MARRLRSLMIYLLLIPIGFLVIGTILYFQQDSMIFFPVRVPMSELQPKAEAAGFESWLNKRGEFLGWQSKDGNPENALLVMHGNGGVAVDCAWYRERARHASGDWKTYLLEYPGYGNREGKCSEKSFTAAGMEAVDELAAPGRKVWVLGFSLGSGVAAATARERPDKIAGLLMMVPFNSIAGMAAFRYPWLPPKLLFLKTHFDSEKNLASYSGPVAFVIAARDRTVPPGMGKKLYEGYKGPKRMWIDPEGDHDVSAIEAAHWPEIVSWLSSAKSN